MLQNEILGTPLISNNQLNRNL